MLYTGRTLDRVAQIACITFHAPERGRFADQRHLYDVRLRGIAAVRPHQCNAVREAGPHDVQLAHHLVVLLLRLGTVDELDAYGRDTGATARSNLSNVFETVQCVLDRDRDEAFDLLGVGAGQQHHHTDGGETRDRVFRFRDVAYRTGTERDQQREHHQRELPAIDEEPGDRVHQPGCAIRTGSPSLT